jgi:glycosyltransferase involved in cell wall biosynthesis
MSRHIAITGHDPFLKRYKGLAAAIEATGSAVTCIPSGNLLESYPFRLVNALNHRILRSTLINRWLGSYSKSAAGYILRSRQTERKLKALPNPPDFVLHIFGSFAPFETPDLFPFGLYLDYTMALAIEEWLPWTDGKSKDALDAWLSTEQDTYRRADVLFTMGHNTARSLVRHYGIDAGKIRVVGSGGSFTTPFEGAKAFGTRRILFQGSEFERKGGDIVLKAFEQVRRACPSCTLDVVGTDQAIAQDGVTVHGIVDPIRMKDLFLRADMVLAPARCDPYTAFVIEALNYGVPCVVSRASGIAEDLVQDETALIVQGLDPLDYAAACLRLLEAPQLSAALADNGRALVRRRFDWAVIASSMQHAISEIASRQH